ncbi:oxidoreductase 2OG-Fe(II) oxygenase family [Fusarium beomiforme]|uniref:Oxidoreductase 2OG-Fe(II) oxygenase family n=1 Tax=Fusarium beomiforme TaxID=44412 RepID=A0A9P5DYA1_9HYPO|nr:oxidoreductase 2OG-Fe(II) oxygenase family [Fusarium beomiforme]
MSKNQASKSYPLEIIDYELLKQREPGEIQRLVQVTRTTGIFFLDLGGPSAAEILKNLEIIYKAEDGFFDRPQVEKLVYQEKGANQGYNHRGPVDVFQISREAQLKGTVRFPAELEAVRSEIDQVMSFSDAALRDIYEVLSLNLKPPAPTREGHDPQKPGRSELTLARGKATPRQVIVPEHRDEGLLSILYYEAPHLEIQDPAKDDWILVQPSKGLHPVYVAETLQRSSKGRLNAALHRVVQAEYNASVASYLLHPAPA